MKRVLLDTKADSLQFCVQKERNQIVFLFSLSSFRWEERNIFFSPVLSLCETRTFLNNGRFKRSIAILQSFLRFRPHGKL